LIELNGKIKLLATVWSQQ